jgi:hypothetical protein
MHVVNRTPAAVAVAGALVGVLVSPLPVHATDQPASAKVAAVEVRLRAAVKHLAVGRHRHAATYDRDRQFGDWITQHGECDTRAVVLKDESLKPTTQTSYCTVKKGLWYSYYNAKYYDNAYGGKVQIDHTVPVENTWVSGAWRWTKATRVRYYNDLGDARTLVGVDAADNLAKGDQDPTQWMPSHGRCRYVRAWVAVKTRWSLTVTAAEKTKLATVAARCPNTTLHVRHAVIHRR